MNLFRFLLFDRGNKNKPEIIADIVKKPTTGVYKGCKFIKKKLPV